jgi:hypothetical protein
MTQMEGKVRNAYKMQSQIEKRNLPEGWGGGDNIKTDFKINSSGEYRLNPNGLGGQDRDIEPSGSIKTGKFWSTERPLASEGLCPIL